MYENKRNILEKHSLRIAFADEFRELLKLTGDARAS